MSPELEAFSTLWRYKKQWLVLVAAAGVLTFLTAAWFWIPDSLPAAVIASFVAALLLALGWAWWMSIGFCFYRDAHAGAPNTRLSIRAGFPRILAVLVWAAVILLLSLARTFGWLPVVIGLLMLAMPLGPALAQHGFSGIWRSRYPLRFWPAAILVLTTACYLPTHLVHWHPAVTGLASQTASMSLRFLLAFLIAVSGWLLLASFLGRLQRGSPDPAN